MAARAARTSRPFSDEPVKTTLSTPSWIASLAAAIRFRQNCEQRGIEAGGARQIREEESDFTRARCGLQQHGIARDERVQRMNRGQEERVISRPDDEHGAEGWRCTSNETPPNHNGRPRDP